MTALIQLAKQALVAIGIGTGVELLLPGQQFGFDAGRGGGGGFLGFGGARRRRRRRKALTATDISLLLTINASIGKKAAEIFLAQRTRAT